MADGPLSVVDKIIPPPTLALSALPGEQYAAMLANLFKLADNIFAVLNTPVMLELRQRQDVQAILNSWDNDLRQAQSSGNISKIDQESSG